MFGENLPLPKENNGSESHVHWQSTSLVKYELSLGSEPDLWDLFTYQPEHKELFHDKLLATFEGFVSSGNETSVRDDLGKEIINVMSKVAEEEGAIDDKLWAARLHGVCTMAEALKVTIVYDRDRFELMTKMPLANGKTLMEELLSKNIASMSGLDNELRTVAFFSLLKEAEDIAGPLDRQVNNLSSQD